MRLARKAGAELIGAFALVFAGCGSLMVLERMPGAIAPAAVPAVFGLVVACMIYAVGHISGAHFNPAVTLAFSVAGHFPPREVAAYWSAQIGGALLALSLLHLLLPVGTGYGGTTPTLGPAPALGLELLLSFLLMFVITAVATDGRAQGVSAGLAIGGMIAVCAYLGGPLTGASMNPARSLAPALFEGRWDGLWIYIVGPCVGATLAALTYEWVRCDPASKSAKGCC